MQCTSPFLLDKVGLIPCGRCLACKIAHSREWVLRLMHEKEYHDGAVFVSLTYNQDSYPKDGNLDKKELQNYFKRLRKGFKRKIKYFAIGDYGEDRGRAHYHAIIFGLKPCTICRYCTPFKHSGQRRDLFELPKNGTDCYRLWKAWQGRGFLDIGTVTDKSCRYVTDYMMDKGKGDNYYGRVKPFQLQSQGLGLRYAWDNYGIIRDNLCCTFRGVSVSIPRYYLRKFELKADTEDFIRIIKKGSEEKQKIYNEVSTIYQNVKDERERYYLIKDHLKKMNDQRGITIASRMRCKKK